MKTNKPSAGAMRAADKLEIILECNWSRHGKLDIARIIDAETGVKELAEKLKQLGVWLDKLADSAAKGALDSRNFKALQEAYEHDAKNFRATAADIE